MVKDVGRIEKVFYYLRTKNAMDVADKKQLGNKPVVTVCLMMNERYILSRGISLCSLKDNPNKKEGRGNAYSRALGAFVLEESSGKIIRDEARKVLHTVESGGWPQHKSGYAVMSSDSLEHKLSELLENKIRGGKA